MKLEDKELLNIVGGSTTITSSLLNSAARVMECIIDIGRSLGTAIRRIYTDNLC